MDAPTVGVLRDVALLAWLALLLGAAAYKWVRLTRPAAVWSWSGGVDARAFVSADALVVAAIALLLLGGLQSGTTEGQKATSTELSAGALLGSMAVQLTICAVLLFYLRNVRGLNPAILFGLRPLRPLKAIGLAVLFLVPALAIINVAAYGVHEWLKAFWPDMSSQDSVEAFRRSSDPGAKMLLIVAAVVVAPVVEETVFRGFIYGVVKRFTDSYFAALCSALLFAVVHYHVGSLFPLALLALAFCAAYERSGSLLTPMLMHALFNSISLIQMILHPTTP